MDKIAELLEFEKKVVEEGEEVAEKKDSCVQNIQELFMCLKYSGVDFGAEQAHILQKSLNDLAFREGAKYARVFGKVYGKVRDLWVAEMEVADKDEFDHNKFR